MSMKIWGKRMLALACAGAMLVPLAACGSDADAGKIRLSYLSWDNEQTSKPYIDEFEKENPDIKIDFSYAPPTSEYISTLQTRLVATRPRTCSSSPPRIATTSSTTATPRT